MRHIQTYTVELSKQIFKLFFFVFTTNTSRASAYRNVKKWIKIISGLFY